MTIIRRINVSRIEGNDANSTEPSEIRPFGETAFYLDTSGNNDKLTLMMFDGARTHLKSKVLAPGALFGSNADSGDGASLDTIKLIPDAALHFNDGNFGNDQYIIVDPTAPNHIHLRAGGTIDDSNAALYIGGEASNVMISAGSNPPVFVTANNNSWQFGTDGVLTLPGSNNARIGDEVSGLVIRSGAGFAVVANANSVNTYEVEFIGYIHNGFGDAPGATLTVTEMIAGTITNGMTIYGAGLPPQGWVVTVGSVPNPGSGGIGNYELNGANLLTSFQSFNNGVLALGSQSWVFSNNGSITFPDATVQTTAYTGVTVPTTILDLGITDGTNGQVLTANGDGTFSFTTVGGVSNTLDGLTDVVITTPATGQVLKFDGINWVNDTDATGSLVETDPVFTASAAAGITGTQVTNWDTAHGWGDHAAAGYLVPTINTTAATATALADDATANLELTGGRAYVMYKIQTSHAAWVRIYTSAAARTADAGRLQGVDPGINAGVVAEAITAGAETVVFAPAVNGFNDEVVPTSAMPIAVTNLSGATNDVVVTVTKLTMVA